MSASPDPQAELVKGRALLLGLVLAAVAYVAAHAGALPLVRYLPLDGRWTFDPPAGAVSMGYFGLLLTGALAYVLGYRIGRTPPARRVLASDAGGHALRVAAGVAVVGMAAYVVVIEVLGKTGW